MSQTLVDIRLTLGLPNVKYLTQQGSLLLYLATFDAIGSKHVLYKHQWKKWKNTQKKCNFITFFFLSFAVIVRYGIFASVPICQSPQGRTKGSRIFGSRGTLPPIHCHCRSLKYRYKSRCPQKSFQTSWNIPEYFDSCQDDWIFCLILIQFLRSA